MRRPNLLIGLFLAAVALTDVLILCLTGGLGMGGPWAVLVSALSLSQLAMTATWLALGRTVAPIRAVAAFAVLSGWTAILRSKFDAVFSGTEQFLDIIVVVTTMLTAAVATPLLVARVIGVRVAHVPSGGATRPEPPGLARFQFTIRYMLGWMTAVAIILGTTKYMIPYDRVIAASKLFSSWPFIVSAAAFALAACGAIWAALGTRSLLARIAVLIAAFLCALGTKWAFGLIYGDTIIQDGLNTVCLLAPLCVFRLAGYRLVLRRTASPVEPPADAERSAGGGG